MIKEYSQAMPWSYPPCADGLVTLNLRFIATAQPHMDGSTRVSMPGGEEFIIIEDYHRFVRDWQSTKA